MMVEWIATQAPSFTLYGDGTIVFRDPMLEPPPAIGSVTPMQPFRTAKLTEEQVQDLLAYALGEGGLGAARPEYRNDLVADASTAVFTVEAGGLKKTVSVYALGMDQPGQPDAAARAALARLAARLHAIDFRRNARQRGVRARSATGASCSRASSECPMRSRGRGPA